MPNLKIPHLIFVILIFLILARFKDTFTMYGGGEQQGFPSQGFGRGLGGHGMPRGRGRGRGGFGSQSGKHSAFTLFVQNFLGGPSDYGYGGGPQEFFGGGGFEQSPLDAEVEVVLREMHGEIGALDASGRHFNSIFEYYRGCILIEVICRHRHQEYFVLSRT